MDSTLYLSNGLIVLADGQVIAIESVQYSADGLTNWESTFNPNTHISTIDNVTTVGGHKYRRVKHAGDSNWQSPALFVPNDPSELEYQVTSDNEFQIKLSSESTWTTIFDIDNLRGEQGEAGVSFTINRIGALDVRPANPTGNSGSCPTCNPTSSCGCGDNYVYLSIGNHIIVTADTVGTQYHSLDGIVWVQTTASYIGVPVFAWGASVDDGTGAYSCNSQGIVVALTSLIPPYTNLNSTGKVYAWDCVNLIWQEIYNFTVTTGQVKLDSGDTLGYLGNKLGNSLEVTAGDLLQVSDGGIGATQLASNSVTTIKINANAVTAAKLNSDVAGDAISLDGVDNSINVNVDDSTIEINGSDQLQVKDDGIGKTKINADIAGLGLSQAIGGELDVNVDGSTLEINTDTLRVKDLGITTGKIAANAITIPKLATNIADTTRGLAQDGSGLYANVDATTIGYTAAPNYELEVKDGGITPAKFDATIVDTAAGIELTGTNKIAANINTTKMEFDSGEISIKDSYITNTVMPAYNWGDITSTGGSITVTDGTNTVADDLNIEVNPANVDHNSLNNLTAGDPHTQYLTKAVVTTKGDIYAATASGTLTRLGVGSNGKVLTADSAEATGLKWVTPASSPSAGSTVAQLDGTNNAGSSSDYSKADHKHDFGDASIAQAKVVDLVSDLANKVEFGTYDNIQIHSTYGILINSPSGARWFKLVAVDEAGNLGTVDVTALI